MDSTMRIIGRIRLSSINVTEDGCSLEYNLRISHKIIKAAVVSDPMDLLLSHSSALWRSEAQSRRLQFQDALKPV